MEKDWLIIKIFPVYKADWSNALLNVWKINEKYRSQLEELTESDENFFLHYADTKVPEGPHFKFFVSEPKNRADFAKWVEDHKQDDGIKNIELHNGSDDKTMQEGLIARKIFDEVKEFDKTNQLRELKKILLINAQYQSLSEGTGRHYLRNMLKMAYPEEAHFF